MAARSKPFLEMRGIAKTFTGVPAIADGQFSIDRDEVHAKSDRTELRNLLWSRFWTVHIRGMPGKVDTDSGQMHTSEFPCPYWRRLRTGGLHTRFGLQCQTPAETHRPGTLGNCVGRQRRNVADRGVGSMSATLAGELLIGLNFSMQNFENGKGLISFSAYWQSVIRGICLLAVVILQARTLRLFGRRQVAPDGPAEQ